jgi:hypothetical protein
MKKSEVTKKVNEINAALDLEQYEKMRRIEMEMTVESREGDRNRARSITVGTAFGGTTEVMMRSDGGRHVWCAMQPVEVIELIHQLAANVGCNADLKPRKDFSSWRDWRVSDAEKKHLQGQAPFVNDMAVFQKLGASGYNDEEAKQVMDTLANIKEFANEYDDSEIIAQETKRDGAPSLMIGKEDGLIHNRLVVDENNGVLYMAGGNGGIPEGVSNETMATKKTVNQRKFK